MCTYDIPGWVAVSKSLLLSQSPLLHKFMIHLIMITSGGCSMASYHLIAYWGNNVSQKKSLLRLKDYSLICYNKRNNYKASLPSYGNTSRHRQQLLPTMIA